MTLYILACGSYCENVTDELPPLKTLVRESTGKSVRRVGRFIQLALIGAGRTSAHLPKHSAVYLSSGRGDTAAMVEVFDEIYRQGQAPRPVSFINTVSNAACYYVAHTLNLIGASSFIGSQYLSFEMALKTAQVDLQTMRIDSALVGVVDTVVAPVPDHRRRQGLDASTVLAEGSHWLHLVREPDDRPVLASMELVQQFGSRAALSQWLSTHALPTDGALATGQHINTEEAAALLLKSGLRSFEYRKGIGYFESLAGRALGQFIASQENSLLYINGDPHGRYVVLVMNKPAS